MDFTSGYVLRALDQLPHQGDREPWRLRQSYLRDRRTIRRAPLETASSTSPDLRVTQGMRMPAWCPGT